MTPRLGAYVIGLDHLRAFAAVMVFSWHGLHQLGVPFGTVPNSWIASLMEEGWIGVSLFITITGFVFTIQTHGKKIEYFAFLKNRFLRLVPLIFLVTLYAVNVEGKSNQSLFLFFGLLGGGTVYGTWTLIVEFQFYAAYPFLRERLVFDSVTKTIGCCGLLLLFLTVLRVACFSTMGSAQNLAYWTIFGQGDAFIAGILAGLMFLHLRDHPPRSGTIVYVTSIAVSFTGIVCAAHGFNAFGGFYNQAFHPSRSVVWIFWPTIIAVLWASTLVFYCLLTLQRRDRLTRSIAYLGTISYSTYMLHFITLGLSDKVYRKFVDVRFFDADIWNSTAILLLFHYPITIAMSAISYEIIEKAFLQYRVPYLTERNPSSIQTDKVSPMAVAA
ncbi:acyltransferase family protein [Phyllobacterium endophyticum]|uniref:acyltransferase family protein n=1 Tax=Phyllobacterium endophyticum TaxID=1149773 RepID=UPI0011CB5937|nr:acyltransferase [Phyllobacterium endophyticum]TXR48469.1 acyltransferase [Phyllobacterium endophyticum]